MKGSITRRGKNSWRLKFDVGRDPATGVRDTKYVTVRGTKKQAQEELTRLLAARDAGTFVDPSKQTVGEFLTSWIDTAETLAISGKTAERYRSLIDKQIIPHLGTKPLQKLKPSDVVSWHKTLLVRGGAQGGPLSPRTVGHAHRVLHKALSDGVRQEVIVRNVAAAVSPPKVDEEEMATLTAEQVRTVVDALRNVTIYPHIVVLLTTGMRRGELMGLRWGDIDFKEGKLRIERAVEATKTHGLRIKGPKTANGRRTIRLASATVAVLKEHRARCLEIRMSLGLGRLPDDAYVFGDETGAVRHPDYVTRAWRRCVASKDIPNISLHALRHSHASALIAGNHDPVTVSRRLGHANPAVTMKIYAHLFDRGDEEAASTMDALLEKGAE